MKIATIIIRTLLGILFIYASISFFLKLSPEPETTDAAKAFHVGLLASTYILPLAKGLEFLCGLSFITGKFVSLSNIMILPVSINILLINFYLTPESLPIAVFILLSNLFLIYRYWANYKSVFTP